MRFLKSHKLHFLSLFIVVIMGSVLSEPVRAQTQDEQAGAEGENLTHVVQPGDNLYRISLRYGVSMDAIAAANDITNRQRILRGQVLVIPGLSVPDSSPEVSNPLVAGTPVKHVVQRGQSLTTIARRYGVTVGDILQANNIANANRIYPGQELNIWTDEPVQEAAASDAPETAAEPAQVAEVSSQTYVVQPGEHLAQIAERFRLDWRVLADMNGIANPNRVLAGQEIQLPVTDSNGNVVDMGILSPAAGDAPSPTVTQGKQIVVDLSDSRVYAYENGQLVRNVLVSTGLPATPTVTGNFTVQRRVRAQTMSGPGYYLPNVEWVLYFYQGYALHGTYWHSNWGQPMSHGCVNMPNGEARWLYENFGEIGTPVLVRQ